MDNLNSHLTCYYVIPQYSHKNSQEYPKMGNP